MNRRSLGAVLLLLGLAVVAAGVVLMAVIVPGMKRFPDDVDVTREYEGTLAVMLNPADFTFLEEVPVTIERHVSVQDTDGDLALVREEQILRAGTRRCKAWPRATRSIARRWSSGHVRLS